MDITQNNDQPIIQINIPKNGDQPLIQDYLPPNNDQMIIPNGNSQSNHTIWKS